MRATEFADYFEFMISLNNDGYKDELWNKRPSKYIVEDNQEVFHTRCIDDVNDLVFCFGSMLMDYVDCVLEDHGFEFDNKNDERDYYEAAADWVLDKDCELYDTDTAHIVLCLAGEEVVEDDVA